jgi:hypothetical protein
MKGVKKLLLNDQGRACWLGSSDWRGSLPAWSRQDFAEAINRFFPNLIELYIGTLLDSSYSVISFLKSPTQYNLVPMEKAGDYTTEAERVQKWKEEWAEMQESLEEESVCPEVKTMWVVKRSKT